MNHTLSGSDVVVCFILFIIVPIIAFIFFLYRPILENILDQYRKNKG